MSAFLFAFTLECIIFVNMAEKFYIFEVRVNGPVSKIEMRSKVAYAGQEEGKATSQANLKMSFLCTLDLEVENPFLIIGVKPLSSTIGGKFDR